jgi:hypothetical protein
MWRYANVRFEKFKNNETFSAYQRYSGVNEINRDLVDVVSYADSRCVRGEIRAHLFKFDQ